MEAERDTSDRYVAAFLAERVGQILACRITGVLNFGFFATVEELGGDGLVPVSTLGADYFRYDEAAHALEGEESGERYALGDKLDLRLVEADPVSGALRFEIPQGASHLAMPGGNRGARGRGPTKTPRPIKRRGRPANIKHSSRKRGPVKR